MLTGLEAIFFYVFAFVAVAAAFMVIASRNPVHSVLYLILTFFNAAGLFLLTGAEFLAMILLIVYVGAVAVLFLFVVMMLDVDFVRLREGFTRYMPFGAIVACVLLIEMILVSSAVAARGAGRDAPGVQAGGDVSNVEAIGRVLYTDYVYIFQAAGVVLLVAMIGAIVLTLRHKPHVKRQDIHTQVTRDRKKTLAMTKPATGAGVRPEDLT